MSTVVLLTDIGSTQASIKLAGFDNDMGSKRILNVATPTASTDAATKTYVDNLQTTITSLTPIVNELSTAPAFDNTLFWNSLRREKAGSGTTLVYLYYISAGYIVSGIGGALYILSIWRRILFAYAPAFDDNDRSHIHI